LETVISKQLGALLRELREARLSQRALAQRLNLSQSMVSAWENGAAIPSAEHLLVVIETLKLDGEERVRLEEARRQAELRSALEPRTIEYILHDASAFLDANPKTTIWMLGPENLPVLEVGSVRETWVRNLERPTSYHLVWVLDWVEPDKFKVALPHFAQIASAAAEKCGEEGRDLQSMGRVHFHALIMQRDTKTPAIEIYRRFCEALAREGNDANQLLEVRPYFPLETLEDRLADAVHSATQRLVHIWQPETSLILYHSPRVATPPVANISLMPVSEEIHTKAAGTHRPMYWLSPPGAAHLNDAVLQLSEALDELDSIPLTKGDTS
jgi:transcriptional regulator with XRE-family HTH domain